MRWTRKPNVVIARKRTVISGLGCIQARSIRKDYYAVEDPDQCCETTKYNQASLD